MHAFLLILVLLFQEAIAAGPSRRCLNQSLNNLLNQSDNPGLVALSKEIPRRELWTRGMEFDELGNAFEHFRKHGKEFMLNDAASYVKKAHNFIKNPPKGTLTFVRQNGDTLYYHRSSNTFAIANRYGTPRTMFRPKNGYSYWQAEAL